nr:MAG TPA_asm: hypothetical protein [Bacteriophage sp.]
MLSIRKSYLPNISTSFSSFIPKSRYSNKYSMINTSNVSRGAS